MQEEGFDVTYLPVQNSGLLNLDDLKAAIRPDTALVSVMAVHNEIGVIQPLAYVYLGVTEMMVGLLPTPVFPVVVSSSRPTFAFCDQSRLFLFTMLLSPPLPPSLPTLTHPPSIHREIGKICRERKVFFHTDAAQAAGKIPLDVDKMNIDLMSISGHKIYGPKGEYFRSEPIGGVTNEQISSVKFPRH